MYYTSKWGLLRLVPTIETTQQYFRSKLENMHYNKKSKVDLT